MAPGQVVDVGDLPPEVRADTGVSGSDGNWRRALETEVAAALARGDKEIFANFTHSLEGTLITQALTHTGGRRIEASTVLGIGRNTLTRKVAELGLERADRVVRATDTA